MASVLYTCSTFSLKSLSSRPAGAEDCPDARRSAWKIRLKMRFERFSNSVFSTLVQGFGFFFLFGEALFPLPLLLGDAFAKGTFLLGEAFVSRVPVRNAFDKQPFLCAKAFRCLAAGFLQAFATSARGRYAFGSAVQ